MIIASQNLSNYDVPVPKNTIFRINLAWINSIQELIELLVKHEKEEIFLDLPIGRTKPPNNKYSINDLIPILNEYKNIKYLAISNVNSKTDLKISEKIPSNVILVPKIESLQGIKNIDEIISEIPSEEKIIMLDHDDLYSSIIKSNEPHEKFKESIQFLVDYCSKKNINLLRTIGVIFGTEEKRTTDYVR